MLLLGTDRSRHKKRREYAQSRENIIVPYTHTHTHTLSLSLSLSLSRIFINTRPQAVLGELLRQTKPGLVCRGAAAVGRGVEEGQEVEGLGMGGGGTWWICSRHFIALVSVLCVSVCVLEREGLHTCIHIVF